MYTDWSHSGWIVCSNRHSAEGNCTVAKTFHARPFDIELTFAPPESTRGTDGSETSAAGTIERTPSTMETTSAEPRRIDTTPHIIENTSDEPDKHGSDFVENSVMIVIDSGMYEIDLSIHNNMPLLYTPTSGRCIAVR